jgi:hypothetical protein
MGCLPMVTYENVESLAEIAQRAHYVQVGVMNFGHRSGYPH